MKCEGLTPEQLATRSVPPSTLSLLGLVRHMAAVEQSWFRRVMGRDLALPRLYDKLDRPRRRLRRAEPTQAASTRRSRRCGARWRTPRSTSPASPTSASSASIDDGDIELREVLVHMVEEYARHCGHADLLRECHRRPHRILSRSGRSGRTLVA